MKKTILFICTGNSCRSVMAEAILRKRLRELGRDDIEVRSAGVSAFEGMPPSDETIEVVREEGVDVSDYRTKRVTTEMVRKADLILVMEPAHKEDISGILPEAAEKTFLLKEFGRLSPSGRRDPGVSDPIGKPAEEYRATKDEIKAEIERLIKKL
ncbi:MAG: low molecular weight protein arginine phosphatase [Candidatus Omnitrophota bacterium]